MMKKGIIIVVLLFMLVCPIVGCAVAPVTVQVPGPTVTTTETSTPPPVTVYVTPPTVTVTSSGTITTSPFDLGTLRLINLAQSPEAKQYVAILRDGFNSAHTERLESEGAWLYTWETIGYFTQESGSSKESGLSQNLLPRSSWFKISDFDYYEQTRFGTKPTWIIYDDGRIFPSSSSAIMLETDVQQLNNSGILK